MDFGHGGAMVEPSRGSFVHFMEICERRLLQEEGLWSTAKRSPAVHERAKRALHLDPDAARQPTRRLLPPINKNCAPLRGTLDAASFPTSRERLTGVDSRVLECGLLHFVRVAGWCW